MKALFFILLNNLCVFSLFSQRQESKIIPPSAFSRQQFTILKNADPVHAIPIKDSIAGPFNVSKGFGTQREIIPIGPYYRDKEYQLASLCCHTPAEIRNNHDNDREDNSVWFSLSFDRDTILSFDIVPIDSTDDFDLYYLY